jgi:hypothetical protein
MSTKDRTWVRSVSPDGHITPNEAADMWGITANVFSKVARRLSWTTCTIGCLGLCFGGDGWQHGRCCPGRGGNDDRGIRNQAGSGRSSAGYGGFAARG